MNAAKDGNGHGGSKLGDPQIIGFDHVQLMIPVDEEDLARGFWVDIMGFVEIPKPVETAGNGAWFQAGDAQIHVGVDSDFTPTLRAHPAIAIRDLRRFVADRGLDVEWSTEIPSITRCQVFDPFGNRIELIDPVRNS